MRTTDQHIEAIGKAIARLVEAVVEDADLWSPSLGLRDALHAPFQGTTASAFGAAFVSRYVKPGEFPNDNSWQAIERLLEELETGGHMLAFCEQHLVRDLGL
ncbi:hypothetical protein N005_01220 [Pseudomonas mediterranea CFBP 5447]|nr:hypothetical protein N005_01220 [Pseudomonas mediterranea CFBP 5447]